MRTITFFYNLILSIITRLSRSSKIFIAKTEEKNLDHHTISISTR